MVQRNRKRQPRAYRTYRLFRSDLRIELDYSCAYCDIWETENGTAENFEIDHYRPIDQFPHLKCDYDNLLYSCSGCNRIKSNFTPAAERPEDYCLNLFEHDLDIHIDKSKPEWTKITDTGEFNILLFGLSQPFSINRRRERANAVAKQSEYSSKTSDLDTLIQKLESDGNLQDAALLRSLMKEQEQDLARISTLMKKSQSAINRTKLKDLRRRV